MDALHVRPQTHVLNGDMSTDAIVKVAQSLLLGVSTCNTV